MIQTDSYNFFCEELKLLKKKGLLRTLKNADHRIDKWIYYNGEKILNLSSNNYLGLASDTTLHGEFYKLLNNKNIIDSFGLGSTSSRLLTGNHSLYQQVEDTLEKLYNRNALIFNSGYHANIGVIPALVGKSDLILADKLNHASIIDGMRLSGAKFYRFNHMDYDHLEKLLKKHQNSFKKILIITESLFSMDGDIADLKRLVELKEQYKALLYVDEAHAVGVYGEKGRGIAEEQNVIDRIDILLGTFGKAFASIGAFVICDSIIKEYLINKVRSLIFTTSLPPVNMLWNQFVITKIPLMSNKRKHLKELSLQLRKHLISCNLETIGKSQIIPIIIGENKKTVQMSKKLLANNFLLFPIRPPTVPEGTSRIRISLTSDLSWENIEKIPKILQESEY